MTNPNGNATPYAIAAEVKRLLIGKYLSNIESKIPLVATHKDIIMHRRKNKDVKLEILLIQYGINGKKHRKNKRLAIATVTGCIFFNKIHYNYCPYNNKYCYF